jgi:hypothetical protein
MSNAHFTILNLNHFKMVEAMGLKLSHRGPLEWGHIPTKSHENLPVGSRDIHRSFVPNASNAFRSFLPYSKLHALVT